MVDSIGARSHTPGMRIHSPWTALVLTIVVSTAGCATATSSASASSTTSRPSAAGASRVQAVRLPLTTSRTSSVAHDTETLALVPHAGRLFAATGQWMYPGSPAHGQVLVQESADEPWKVFEATQSLRVQALDSFPIPVGQGLGARHSLLVTAAIIDSRSEIQWLRDDAHSFASDDAFPLASKRANVRAFGAHEDGGVWSVFAGVAPTGILRGTWSPRQHTLVFDPMPELSTASPGLARPADAEGHRLRGLCRRPVRVDQHEGLSQERRRPPAGRPPLGARVPGASGRVVQQRRARVDLRRARWRTVVAALDRGQRRRVAARPPPARSPCGRRTAADPQRRTLAVPRHPPDARRVGDDRAGARPRVDRVRDRGVQQLHRARRSRRAPAALRLRVGLRRQLSVDPLVRAHRVSRHHLRLGRVLRDPERRRVVADVRAALPEWLGLRARLESDLPDPRRPGLRVDPVHRTVAVR